MPRSHRQEKSLTNCKPRLALSEAAIEVLEKKILKIGGSKLLKQKSTVDGICWLYQLANEEVTKAEPTALGMALSSVKLSVGRGHSRASHPQRKKKVVLAEITRKEEEKDLHVLELRIAYTDDITHTPTLSDAVRTRFSEARARINGATAPDVTGKDVMVVSLGMIRSIPCKSRNVAGTLLCIPGPGPGYILLDTGEDMEQLDPSPEELLYLISHRTVFLYLRDYNPLEELGFSDMHGPVRYLP
ncbi:hypothetical protein BDR05DRAFT_953125 [Suillus weaverae]|nr:hypothetical protein BDR05DRAFT_953125 [Suillus weaverae]